MRGPENGQTGCRIRELARKDEAEKTRRLDSILIPPGGITFPNQIAGTSSISAHCEANATSHAHTGLEEGKQWRMKVRERQS
jgi:hypothetical protein